MNLKEYEDNQYTKEKDEVEKYLLRIAQRYFDIENNYTQESIEAMILESLTRFKQMVVSETGFIFSLNQQTGKLTLTANDFGGELAFDKNTAFNKDFGADSDTICEGNDSRLSDEREPLAHVHEMSEILTLQEELEKVGVPSNLHVHNNKDILDMLTYAGTQTQIDLTILDNLEAAANEYRTNLEIYQRELKVTHERNIEKLLDCIFKLQQTTQNASELVNNAVNWLHDARTYTNTKVNEWRISVLEKLTKYATKSQMQKLTNALKKTYDIKAEGEIPLTNGTISLTPVKDVYYMKNNGRGSVLRKIFNEGLIIGGDNWIWDSINHSVSYFDDSLSNSMIVSPCKFDTYTHRVTVKSDSFISHPPNVITIVIAYDEVGDNNLVLALDNIYPLYSNFFVTNAQLAFNLKETGRSGSYSIANVYGERTLTSDGEIKPWDSLEHGITVLIKRNKNNIKIWLNYEKPNIWFPTKQNGIEDIYISQAPDIEINLDEHPELSMFTDTKNNFGYGTHYQTQTKYTDVYFSGQTEIDEDYGHANIMDYKETKHQVSNFKSSDRVKMFFKYDKNGQTITQSLPYTFTDEYGNKTLIQGTYTTDGTIQINSGYINNIPMYVTDENLYNDTTVIAIDNINKDIFYFTKTRIQESGGEICKIDSENKNTFVANLLKPDVQYLIDGEKSFVDNTYYDKDGNALSYFNWADNYPDAASNKINIVNENGLWKNVSSAGEYNAVAEYKIKRFTDYFENPRVYYQILGNKEVV